MVFGLALVMALVLGAASVALGADGDFFKVGRSNLASAVSTLTKSGAGPALRLNVDSGAPLAVNSTTKVAKLNADKLDNLDSAAFQRANAAAGGDLSGTYPNPQIAPGSVGSEEVEDGSLRVGDIASAHDTLTIDQPNIPAGACGVVSDVDGSFDAGDLPIVVPPVGLPSGLVAYGIRTEIDDVYNFRLCNLTGGSIDPPALRFDVVLLRL